MMAAHWTSKNAIMRDLSLAQGREVPGDIEETVGYNDKPPALKYVEETEEEFYTNYVGGGDFNTGPDLSLIQQMLNMVREVDLAEIEEDIKTSVRIIEISKDNVSRQPLQDIERNRTTDTKSPKSSKKKRNRNAAIESLIATYGDIDLNDNNINQSSNSNNIANSSTEETHFQKLTFPKVMFKKKAPSKGEENKSNNNRSKIDELPKSDLVDFKTDMFVPSTFAEETYKRYLEESKLQNHLKQDIWSRAEEKMREIDAKKREERQRIDDSSSSSSASNQDLSSSELKGMEFVRLPQHRHLLTGDCVVCQVLCVQRKEDIGENSQK